MIYNIKKIDDDIFRNSIDHIGREVECYYSGQKDKVLVEPNGSLDGGKIYCRNTSWIKRGDIIKVSGEWYVVMHMSNLASDIYNVGVINRCDVALKLRLGRFVYDVPAVASKYSGNSNVRGVIDDSIEGQLSFITGYHSDFDAMTDNPCITVFGKVWQIGNYLNVNNVMTVYCQGVQGSPRPELCVRPIALEYKVGDSVELDIQVLNTTATDIPDDLRITLSGNVGTIQGNKITFTKSCITSIMIASTSLNTYYVTPDIKVTE